VDRRRTDLDYRGEQGRKLCIVCRALADGRACPRCGRPLCRQHALEAGTLCHLCDEEYLHSQRRVYGMVALVYLAGLLVAAMVVRSWLALGVAAGLLAGLGGVLPVLLRNHRRRFAEATRRRPPEAP
jgi:hypothetical protein